MSKGQAENGGGGEKLCARCLERKPLDAFDFRDPNETVSIHDPQARKDFCRPCGEDLTTRWVEREKRVGPNVHRRRKRAARATA